MQGQPTLEFPAKRGAQPTVERNRSLSANGGRADGPGQARLRESWLHSAWRDHHVGTAHHHPSDAWT